MCPSIAAYEQLVACGHYSEFVTIVADPLFASALIYENLVDNGDRAKRRAFRDERAGCCR